MTRYFINNYSVFLDEDIDKFNGWNAVVYSYFSQDYIQVFPFGYNLLKIIYTRPGISLEEILSLFSTDKDKSKAKDFIDFMCRKGIILTDSDLNFKK